MLGQSHYSGDTAEAQKLVEKGQHGSASKEHYFGSVIYDKLGNRATRAKKSN